MRLRLLSAAALIVAGILAYAAFLGISYARTARAMAAISALTTLNVEFVLGAADMAQLPDAIMEDFDITSSGTTVVGIANRLYEVSAPNAALRMAELSVRGPEVTSIAISGGDNTPLVVAGGMLGSLEADGTVVEAIPLPAPRMRLARSITDGTIYLFGGRSGSHRLYRFYEEGDFQILLESVAPIVAVADNAAAIYAATAHDIVRITDAGAEVAFRMPGDEPLISIAVAAGDEAMYISTPARVYAARGAGAVSVINNSGGSLRLLGDRLYVLDRTRRLLYFVGPTTQMFPNRR